MIQYLYDFINKLICNCVYVNDDDSTNKKTFIIDINDPYYLPD